MQAGVVERQRILRGWTRAQLSEAASIDPKTLRDLLAGRRCPTLGTVSTLSRALGVPLGDFIAIVEEMPPTVPSRDRRFLPDAAQDVLPLQ